MSRSMDESESESASPGNSGGSSAGGSEEENWLPLDDVMAIEKKRLPAKAEITQEAKELMQECTLGFPRSITHQTSCERDERVAEERQKPAEVVTEAEEVQQPPRLCDEQIQDDRKHGRRHSWFLEDNDGEWIEEEHISPASGATLLKGVPSPRGMKRRFFD